MGNVFYMSFFRRNPFGINSKKEQDELETHASVEDYLLGIGISPATPTRSELYFKPVLDVFLVLIS